MRVDLGHVEEREGNDSEKRNTGGEENCWERSVDGATRADGDDAFLFLRWHAW